MSSQIPPSQLFKYGHPIRVGHSLQCLNLYYYTLIAQGPQFTLRFTLGVTQSMDLDKRVMTCIHHYSIIQRIFTLLLVIHPYHPRLLATADLFTVCIVSPFPKCHVAERIQYVVFSFCLLSLNNNFHFYLIIC